MTDRRSRQAVKCREPGCILIGTWPMPLCPTHWNEIRGRVLAELERRRTPDPHQSPQEVADALLGINTEGTR